MNIVPITSSQLDRFVQAGDHPLGADGLAEAVRGMWESGETRPEWCFIIEHDGQPIGRIGYTGNDLTPHELGMFGLAFPKDDGLEAGVLLLRESLRQMRSSGQTHVERRIESGWDNADIQKALLEKAGLPLAQEKLTMRRAEPQPELAAPGRLKFRPIDAIGEEALTDAYRRANEGTLDRIDAAERAIMGDAAHAKVYLHFMRELHFRADWWLAAYASDGSLAGMVLAQDFGDGVGCINAIGVTPEQRGKGYGFDLIAHGTRLLNAGGMSEVIADVDSLNAPVIRAFERAGFGAKPGRTYVYFGEIDHIGQ